MADQAVHILTTLATIGSSLTTLYIDIAYHTGWQKGAYMCTYTHWTTALIFLFQLVSLLDGLTFGLVFAAPRRWLLLTSLATSFNVDCAYLIAVIPPRLMGTAKLDHGPIMTTTSWHTHCINVLWLLADVATLVPKPVAPGVLAAEFAVFGLAVPIAISAAYYWFALTIKDKNRGERLLTRINVPLPREGDGWHVLDVRARGNIEALPGEWVYPAMSSVIIRVLFVGATFLFLLLAVGSRLGAEALARGPLPARLAFAVAVSALTPYLYVPDLTADGSSAAQLWGRFVGHMGELGDWAAQTVAEGLEGLERFDGVSLWADFVVGVLETGQWFRADCVLFAQELLEIGRGLLPAALTQSRRASEKRRSSKRKSKRAVRVATDEAEVPLDFNY